MFYIYIICKACELIIVFVSVMYAASTPLSFMFENQQKHDKSSQTCEQNSIYFYFVQIKKKSLFFTIIQNNEWYILSCIWYTGLSPFPPPSSPFPLPCLPALVNFWNIVWSAMVNYGKIIFFSDVLKTIYLKYVCQHAS